MVVFTSISLCKIIYYQDAMNLYDKNIMAIHTNAKFQFISPPILAFAVLATCVSYNQLSFNPYQKKINLTYCQIVSFVFNVTLVCDSNQDLITSI